MPMVSVKGDSGSGKSTVARCSSPAPPRQRVTGEDVAVNLSPRDPGAGSATTAGPPAEAVGSPGGPSSPGVSGSAPDHRYLLDNARAEAGERFVALAELFDGVTRGHFDRLGVGPGLALLGGGGRRSQHPRGARRGRRTDRVRAGDGHQSSVAGPARDLRGTPARPRRGSAAGAGHVRPGARPARPRPCARPRSSAGDDGGGAAARRLAAGGGRRHRAAAAGVPRRKRPGAAASQPAAACL